MKTCKDCKLNLEDSEFYTYKRGDKVTLYARCKACHLKKTKQTINPDQKARNRRVSRANAQALVNEAKSVPCADCGLNYPPYVMDFDHVKGDKFKSIAQMVGRYSLSDLLAEIEKCEVVCSNCHRVRTHTRKLGY